MIRAARASRKPSRSSKACFRSTKTSVCRTTRIARNALSPSKCENGNERQLEATVYDRRSIANNVSAFKTAATTSEADNAFGGHSPPIRHFDALPAFGGLDAAPNFAIRIRAAFTLIELLVVITIIAVLMGLAFPAFQGVQNQAKRTQARNDLMQIVTAVNAYYTEYGRYPLTPATPSRHNLRRDYNERSTVQ